MTLKDFTAFNPFDVLQCARLSSQAYGNPPRGAIRFSADVSDTQGFVLVNQDVATIVFRGTSNLRDAVTDCRARLVEQEFGRAHRGFILALDSVIEQILDILNRKLFKAQRIVITGHSLGGALAMLCAARFAAIGRRFDSVYTFGQPRVGDSAFATRCEERFGALTFRMVNRFDPVPWLPGVLLGYRHMGQELFVDADDRLIVNPSLWDKLARVWHELAAQPALLMGPLAIAQLINDADAAIGDHSAAGYESLTRSIAKQLLNT